MEKGNNYAGSDFFWDLKGLGEYLSVQDIDHKNFTRIPASALEKFKLISGSTVTDKYFTIHTHNVGTVSEHFVGIFPTEEAANQYSDSVYVRTADIKEKLENVLSNNRISFSISRKGIEEDLSEHLRVYQLLDENARETLVTSVIVFLSSYSALPNRQLVTISKGLSLMGEEATIRLFWDLKFIVQDVSVEYMRNVLTLTDENNAKGRLGLLRTAWPLVSRFRDLEQDLLPMLFALGDSPDSRTGFERMHSLLGIVPVHLISTFILRRIVKV